MAAISGSSGMPETGDTVVGVGGVVVVLVVVVAVLVVVVVGASVVVVSGAVVVEAEVVELAGVVDAGTAVVAGADAASDEHAASRTTMIAARSRLASPTTGISIEQFGAGEREEASGRHPPNANEGTGARVREAVGMVRRRPATIAARPPNLAVLLIGAAAVATSCSSTKRPTPVAEAAPVDAATTTALAITTDVTNDVTNDVATAAAESPVATSRPVTTTGPPATSSTTIAPTTTTEPAWPRTISLAFSGDTLPHSPLWRQAERNAAAAGLAGHDFDPMLAGLASVVAAADLAVCHLETPIAPDGEEYTTMPRYGVPEQVADAIVAAGYDRCSTASNHTADRGTAGIDRTVDVLESRGLGQSGMARTPTEIEPHVFDVGGVTVSHLSYTWSYNGLSLPESEEWRSAIIDPERVTGDALMARIKGADVVLVSMHWGAEGVHEPTRFQRQVADEVTASGHIDLVIGHHAHVLQPIEQVNDTCVLFGLGNILSNLPTSNRWPAASQDAAVVTVDVTVDEQGDVSVDRPVAHATWVDKDAGWTAVLVEAELARDDISAGQRGRLERSLERTRGILGDFFPG